MTYRDRLYPWHIVRLLPQAKRITVAQFRNRNQADSHARILRQLIPGGTFVILFDPPPVKLAGEPDPRVLHLSSPTGISGSPAVLS